jgi:hypothetical protein
MVRAFFPIVQRQQFFYAGQLTALALHESCSMYRSKALAQTKADIK